MFKIIYRLAVPAAIGMALAAAGCGGPKEVQRKQTGATLQGTVTYGKDKVPVALVIAKGADSSAQNFADDDGRYRIENVPTGEVTVAVNTDAAKGNLMGRYMAASKTKAKPPRLVVVPKKYQDPTTSGIKTTVHVGENTFNINIAH
jgi:hypothetical protein